MSRMQSFTTVSPPALLASSEGSTRAGAGARVRVAERTLPGEFSIAAGKGDRDHDCVPDIATARLPAPVAGEITIERA